VFECKLLPGYVVKVEESPRSFENIAEWMTYQAAGRSATRWLAMCKSISPDGKILIMERTRPPARHELPARVPVWCSDLKVTNWGMATDNEGQSGRWAVCHDYGSLSSKVLERGIDTRTLKKADWIFG
jgi:hypothetical protein